MNVSRLHSLLAAAWLAVCGVPAGADTVTQEAELTRAQLETAGATLVLSATDALASTRRTLTLELRYADPPLAVAGGNAWTYTVRYRIQDGASLGPVRSLTLFRGTDRDVFRAADGVQLTAQNATIRIDGTTTTDAAAVPAAVVLAARVESIRYTAFARNSAPVLTRTSGAEPQLQWTAVPGAEEYEVESVFFDALEPAAGSNPFAQRLPVRFQLRERSTPLDAHRTSGMVYYRVRAVGRQPADPRVRRPGAWSTTLAVAVSGGGFEAGKNWYYDRAYDGSGPAQANIGFLDGVLRLRQAQSGAPGETSRRIAETKFDHEGRPAVNFLAAPEPGTTLAFAPGFNRAADGTPYGPEHFDRDAVVGAAGTSGAGRYFSGANTAGDPLSPYLPDAGGYPFSVAEHKRDDSARLRAISGFGAPQRIGSGHESVYVYGDAADAQLRPLFGTNLGNAAHFERTVTGDANRSFEVVYRDGSDRIVAQSLVGDAPANLADLPNAPQPSLVAVSMDANNRVDATAGRSTLNYRIANAVNTSYFFAYSPTGVEYGADPNDARFPRLCATCRYRLTIRVLDPDGTPVPLARSSTPQSDPNCTGIDPDDVTPLIEQTIQNPNAFSCPANPVDFTRGYTVPPVRFCARLTEPGEYEVQKTLEFLDGDIDAGIEEHTRQPGFFDVSTYRKPADPESCGQTCLAHCAAATGIDPAVAPNDPQLRTCVERCENPESWVLDIVDSNKCTTLENTLRQDLQPGGAHYRPNGSNTLADHPEHCHLGVCQLMRTSDRYDAEMGLVEGYDDALCKGYLNPTGLATGGNGPPAPPASCTATPARDPFFASGGPGQSRRTTLNGRLLNFTATIPDWADPTALSLWQFVADARINSVGSAATPTPDEQWRLFRSLYLGAKKRLVIEHTEASSGFNCPFSTASNARVPKPPLPTTVVEVIDAINGVTAQQCTNICAARVEGWMQRLRASCPNPLDSAAAERALGAYCASSCGSNNPLASLLEEDVASGDPNLTAALAALGPSCSLDDVAVPDPYVYQTVCGETCCSDEGPSDCAKKLFAALTERVPAASPVADLLNTPAGNEARSCLDWVDHVRFDRRTVLFDKHETRQCSIVLVAPDGTIVPLSHVRIVGAPKAVSQPPPVRGTASVPYTGLVVDVEWRGARFAAAIYSDCSIRWIEDLKTPHCETTVVSTPPPERCVDKPGAKPLTARAYSPRLEACPVDGAAREPANPVRPARGPARSPPPPPPRDACPSCLDDLEVLLEGRKPGELAALEVAGRKCFIKLFPEGNRLIATQPGGRQCSIYLLDKSGTPVVISTIALFEDVVRGVPPPSGITGPSGSRFMGAGLRVRMTNGTTQLLYLFTDCDLLSAEICGTECTPIARPPVCLSSVLAELMRRLEPAKSPAVKRSNKRDPKKPKSPPPACFTDLVANPKGIATFGFPDGRKCTLVLFDAAGQQRPLEEMRGVAPRWVGTVPSRAPIGAMRFTGYVVLTAKGVELGIYSDCDMPPGSGCETIVVDVEDPIPPPIGDPEDVCKTAVDEAADDRARLEVEMALGEFATTYKSVHYDRCFGSKLRETFGFQARSREYHYTLHYYDQAGNLVQTVPPAGVASAPSGTPAHRLVSKFSYNSLEQVIAQSTPDTGERRFFHDRSGRLRLSQDAQQRIDGTFAFVKYDALGRETEVGLLRGVGEAVVRARLDEPAFPAAADGTLEQVTKTVYDTAQTVPTCSDLGPKNLRGRVAAVIAATTLGMSTLCYSYDIEGRTSAVLRSLPGLGSKNFEYDYDPLTGRVAAIHFQRGQPDALHHRLQFNRRNEIESIESSRDEVLWERDARYAYFAHGPLARVEVGADRVQGVDYTYTIDGRPKGINTGTLAAARDPGHDSQAGGANAAVANDAAGQTLEFFTGDYAPVGRAAGTLAAAADPHASAVSGGAASAFALSSCAPATVADGCGLYEGSVARTVVGLEGLDGFARVAGFAYRYDRLYRLVEATSHDGLDPVAHTWPAGAGQSLWRSAYGYDANGNLRTLSRVALAASAPPTSAAMDSLTYRYSSDTSGRLAANRLEHVNDSVAAGAFPADLDDQGTYAALNAGTHNYAYDAEGNLIRDRAAGITSVLWNLGNRVSEIEVGAEKIEFLYDGLGQRFAKIRKPSSDATTWEVEHFVRDENGSLVATYRTPASAASDAALEELYLRGIGELGVIRAERGWPSAIVPGTYALVRGDKQYQIANHLGHVLATVSDRKIPVLASNGSIARYAPDILSVTDYDPFGAPAPGRFEETVAYRFGFSGFERDDELKGAGNSYFAQDRLFDPRIGRWLSPDAIQSAHQSPYAGFANNPLRFRDPTGQADTDWADLMENVAITTRDIGRDALYVFSGAAVVDAVADNMVKAKDAYDHGQTSEAVAHAIGIQGAIESLAEKDLRWQDGGATVEERVALGIGEVSGVNNIMRGATGATEFDEKIEGPDRVLLVIEGSVTLLSVSTGVASVAKGGLVPKGAKGPSTAPKPAAKAPFDPPCAIPLSFAAGTAVWTDAGSTPIESLDETRSVFSVHPESGVAGVFPITGFTTSRHIDGLQLELEAPGGHRETLTTTSEHPFWATGSGWLEAGSLAVGDEVESLTGTLRVVAISPLAGEFLAYNISVGDARAYLVGEFGVWVHNCKTLNGGKRIARQELKSAPPRRGTAPIGKDGHPVELHHRNQAQGNKSKFDELSRTKHRGGANYKKNHKNTGKSKSKVDRREFKKMQRKHWEKEWDRGRFKNVPKFKKKR